MKERFFSEVKNFRYEKKFVLEAVAEAPIEQSIRLHPAMFREIYYPRTVNNLYLDTYDLKGYFSNLDGVSKRLKVRVRWYGNLFGAVAAPILEFKLKHNQHVGKLSWDLASFTFDQQFSIHDMQDVFRRSSLSDTVAYQVKSLRFSLLNSYRRKYFLSSDGKYRITLDTDVSYYKMSPLQNSFLHKLIRQNNIIMELKYNRTEDETADQITHYFPFRISRCSKYVAGIESLCG